jgi:hypothetical protein
MHSSPFEERPRGNHRPSLAGHIFQSPGPARQLFNNNTPNANGGRQSSFGAATPPSRPTSSRGTPGPPGSALRTTVVKVDLSNEIIRGDLNSVRYELQTLREERQLEKVRHEQELRTLEASVEEQAKRADVNL